MRRIRLGDRLQALHWESWLLRLVLLGVFVFQVLSHNRDGATVAAEGIVVCLLPMLVGMLSHVHVPRALELAFVAGMVLQFGSESTKLFEVFAYWDKLVHPTLVALTALIAGWLLLGYRDANHLRIPTLLMGLSGWFVGACVGAFWEFVEFTGDWFANTDLQKSNGDTMTDMLSNDIGALLATVIGMWIYFHVLRPKQHHELGRIAGWLSGGAGNLLDHHGRLVAAGLAVVVAVLLGASQWVDRGQPMLAAGAPAGDAQQLSFANDPSLSSSSRLKTIAGTWQPDPLAGICNVDLEDGQVPNPGSETIGLLDLAPGAAYGQGGQSFSVSTQYVEVRPPAHQGTQMTAGIAFGIVDANNFYLLEQSALHDILRLDRYVNGKRRDVREKLYRTHANDWHTLQLGVQDDQVTAGIDGQQIFSVSDLSDTAGGIGLWARTAEATCFDQVQVQVGHALPGSAAAPVGRV